MLLAGIVAAQVEILKLGASMGRSLEQTTALTTQNEQLRGSVAALSDDQRIERIASTMGMVLPPPGAVGYIVAKGGRNVGGALANIHTPDPAAFVALAPSNGALVTGAGHSMLPTSAGVLAQAGTPASATPTSTQSPTETVPSASSATSSTTAGTTTTTSTVPTTATQTPAAEQPAPTTSDAQTAPATTPAPAATPQTPSAGTQVPPTGAAAIQPTSSGG